MGPISAMPSAKQRSEAASEYWLDLAKVDIPYQGIGIVARKSFLEQSPSTVERTLKAIVRAITYYQDPANKQNIVPIVAKWLRLQRSEDAEAGYEAVRNLYSRRIFPTLDGIRNTLRILERVDPKYGRLKAESLIDDRLIRKLEKWRIQVIGVVR